MQIQVVISKQLTICLQLRICLSLPTPILVYHQQSSQQPASQSYGYKEPAAPVSIPHSAPTGGGVSVVLH